MIQVSALGWLAFAALIAVSSLLGVGIARHLPWIDAARTRAMGVGIGLALGPFLLGFAGVLALGVTPGAAHRTHVLLVVGVLGALALVSWKVPSRPFERRSEPANDRMAGILAIVLSLFALLLLLDATFLPLVQSDALEYATAGRRLFHLRSLAAYPPLDAIGDPSGFYGPWTHPPLYAALIYLANVCQGSADSPGLMRLLSPWALAASAALVYALGSHGGRRMGLLSALFLVATPSLFLGSDSAQLDALTASGLTIALAGCVGLPIRGASGAVLGALIGAAMWTHSQAILVLPVALLGLLVLHARSNRKVLLLQLSLVALCAIAVGAWPYLRNLRFTGALISDNPAVYALPQLDWTGYFRAVRDMGMPVARLQYGILKGWSTIDAFGLGFWFMTVGAVVLLRRRSREPHEAGGVILMSRRCELVALAFVACYLAGVVVSTLAGIDLMIRNERYVLIIMPCVAILAATGAHAVTTMASSTRGRGSRWASGALLAVLVAMFIAQIPVLFAYRASRFAIPVTGAGLASPLAAKLRAWEPYGAIRALGDAPDSGLVLSLKPSDMYYTGRKMVSYLDPRMLTVYRAPDASIGAVLMRGMGISLIHVPGFATPPLYNSVLQDVLADPRLSRLEHSFGGYQVYRLADVDPPTTAGCIEESVGPDTLGWRWESAYVFGGAKQLFRIGGSEGSLTPAVAPTRKAAAFHRERPTRLTSPLIPLQRPQADRQLRLEVVLTGRGFAHVSVQQHDADGNRVQRDELAGTLLSDASPTRVVARRFLAASHAASIRVIVEYGGQATLGVQGATLAVCRE